MHLLRLSTHLGYFVPLLLLGLLKFYFSAYKKGPPRAKRDGVIRHILEHKNVNWLKKVCDCVNDQSCIPRDWVNLA